MAPLIFLATVIGIAIISIFIVGFCGLFAAANPPLLNGNPVSIVNLYRQLTSPIEVVGSTIGDTPLAMKVLFNGREEGRVHFDLHSRPTSSDNEAKRTSPEEVSLDGSQENQYSSNDTMSVEEARALFGIQNRPLQQQRYESPEPLISTRYDSGYSEANTR